jgi:S-formylglutathione hydrolase FrmB
MMKKLAVLIIIVATLAFWGCSTEDNPLEPTYPHGSLYRAFVNASIFDNQWLEESTGRPVYVYEPYGYSVGEVDSYEVYIDSIQPGGFHYDTTYVNYVVTSVEYPTLYLLHGYGGNYNYFQTLFMVQDILDEMTASGEIIPMLVITPDCDSHFGGGFYTNSPEVGGLDGEGDPDTISYAGLFEDFMVTDLIDYVNERFNADTTAAFRGISGHSMGGYGAITLAMKHPDLYGSVSSMSAPLAFDYLAGLLPAVYAENSLVPGEADTAGFYSIAPNSDRPVTSMMFAMGAAFTPHDGFDADTTYYHRTLDVQYRAGVDLPFKITGALAESSAVWATWLTHDPRTMLVTDNYNTDFDDLPIYIDCADNDDLGLQLHAAAFDAALTAKGIEHSYAIYSGYPSNAAAHSNFIAERLREIFRFHSDIFREAQAAD